MKVNWDNDESNAPQAASGVAPGIAAATALAYCHEPEQELDAERLLMQLTKNTGMRLPQRWASSYNRVACLYIIPTKILSISMTVAMLGNFYQYKDNKGPNWTLFGNMQVMLSLGEGAFQCLLSIALVIKQ